MKRQHRHSLGFHAPTHRHTGSDVVGATSPPSDFLTGVRSRFDQPSLSSNSDVSRPIGSLLRSDQLVARLKAFARLDREEIAAIESLSRNTRIFRAAQTLNHEGRATDSISLIVEGVACRFKMLPGGRRQILGYLIPGDLCDFHFTVFNRPDHSVALLCDSQVATIPIAKMTDLLARYPDIRRALSLGALVDSATLRRWLLIVGRRDATERIGHFFCEMAVRFRTIERVGDDGSLIASRQPSDLGGYGRLDVGAHKPGAATATRRRTNPVSPATLEDRRSRAARRGNRVRGKLSPHIQSARLRVSIVSNLPPIATNGVLSF